jgi:hypothetical protein
MFRGLSRAAANIKIKGRHADAGLRPDSSVARGIVEHGDLEGRNVRGAAVKRAISAGPEKARNQANFVEVQY